MGVAPSEAEVLVAELESRLDRLRALYEQYFLGFEKLEPLIPRKDVDRRFDVIRRLHFRNTALRFKFNMLQQRYNTFQMYWLRICRQIEDGTYQRHLNKAKARAEAEKKVLKNSADGWDVDIDTESNDNADDLFASFESAKTTPPSAPPLFTMAPEPMAALEFDDPFGGSLPPPKLGSDPARPARMAPSLPPNAPVYKPSIPPRIAPSSMTTPPEKKTIVLRKTEPAAPRTTQGSSPVPPSASATPPRPAPSPAPATQAARPVPKAPPSAPKSAPKPVAPGAPSVSKAPPRPPPPPPPFAKAPPPKPAAAISPPTPGPIPRVALPASATGAGVAAAKGVPMIRPKTPEAPRAPIKADDDRKMRDLYTEYVAQKQSRNEATSHLSYDAVAKSLKDSGTKLAAKHEGKRVDFEVALKDGVTVLRPVIK